MGSQKGNGHRTEQQGKDWEGTRAHFSVLCCFFCSKLNFTPLEQDMPVQFQVVELPSSHHLCKVRALNKGDANSEVTVYYQVS